jgi:hypothetical protein
MYAGQALLHAGCGGNAYCHSPLAEGVMREGAPKGLDFNLGLPCVDRPCAPGDSNVALFVEHLEYIRGHADGLYDPVHDGAMPPDGVGRRVVARAGTIRRAPPAGGALADGEELPTIESADGRAIFANWLACGAPVVVASAPPDDTHAPGEPCTSSADAIGACVTRIAESPPPLPTCATDDVPTWEGLYTRLFEPLCADACHGARSPRLSDPSFGDLDATYETLLDQDEEEPLVVPGDALGSHVVHHIEGLHDFEVMPVGLLSGELPEPVRQALRSWIDAGAAAACE